MVLFVFKNRIKNSLDVTEYVLSGSNGIPFTFTDVTLEPTGKLES